MLNRHDLEQMVLRHSSPPVDPPSYCPVCDGPMKAVVSYSRSRVLACQSAHEILSQRSHHWAPSEYATKVVEGATADQWKSHYSKSRKTISKTMTHYDARVVQLLREDEELLADLDAFVCAYDEACESRDSSHEPVGLVDDVCREHIDKFRTIITMRRR